jgi:hypothetical protein
MSVKLGRSPLEHRLRVFQNRVLIYGCKGEEETGSCRKLFNEEL